MSARRALTGAAPHVQLRPYPVSNHSRSQDPTPPYLSKPQPPPSCTMLARQLPSPLPRSSQTSPTRRRPTTFLAIFVSHLPSATKEITLKQTLDHYGTVIHCRIHDNGHATVELFRKQMPPKFLEPAHVAEFWSRLSVGGFVELFLDCRQGRSFSVKKDSKWKPSLTGCANLDLGSMINDSEFVLVDRTNEVLSFSVDFEGTALKRWKSFALEEASIIFSRAASRNRIRVERKTEDGGRTCLYILTVSLSLPPAIFYDVERKSLDGGEKTSRKRIASPKIGTMELPRTVFYSGSLKNRENVFRNAPPGGDYLDHRRTFRFPRPALDALDDERRFQKVLEHLVEYGLVAPSLEVHGAPIRLTDPIAVMPAPPVFDYWATDLDYLAKLKIYTLVTHGNISPFSIDERFIDLLRGVEPVEVAEALLEGLARRKVRIDDPSTELERCKVNLSSIRKKSMRAPKFVSHQTNLVQVRKVIVTPLKIYVTGPNYELSNRISRTYESYQDRFLRVSFTDDNLMPINGGGTERDACYNRIAAILHDGFEIGGRRYQFLHYSNSQLRSAGCWFFSAPDTELTCEKIQGGMGSFAGITNPATFGARMAQCFSSTTVGGKLTKENISEIPDIERNGHVFSDGVGIIGSDIASNLYLKLGG
ncbi:RNA dependent RNA polymerase-domain-containing protein [Blyttiomyces helicus]|uniref:RNA-dependent RNA polymerase n=1 Tax=Blyttiomyces helicus TaxID=388810 RepID=A0A4P9W678_9FUNG|nr:RNA dependent RNA polymerase-domain-containing protein [Blyttiomyces helicus]|eukprot:RKO86863.1 RNA dependent RNA polymerase-domain-containing protein [Blyttiomyces helicus]